MIEGTSQVGTLALFILLIFIELVSAHKSAKREREREREKEVGQRSALCVSSVAFALVFLNARKFKRHHIYHTAHLCTLLNFY